MSKPVKPGNDKNAKASVGPTDRLEELFKLMEDENLQELEITDGPFEVKLVRQGRVPMRPVRGSSGRSAGAPSARSAAPKADEDLGKLVPIKSPLAGVFYRAPGPQAAPFVREGDSIGPEQTTCLVEAMKVLNEINAGVSGTVVRILVENGKPVTAGQNLFLIEPAG